MKKILLGLSQTFSPQLADEKQIPNPALLRANSYEFNRIRILSCSRCRMKHNCLLSSALTRCMQFVGRCGSPVAYLHAALYPLCNVLMFAYGKAVPSTETFAPTNLRPFISGFIKQVSGEQNMMRNKIYFRQQGLAFGCLLRALCADCIRTLNSNYIECFTYAVKRENNQSNWQLSVYGQQV